jgi:hypothetical protein
MAEEQRPPSKPESDKRTGPAPNSGRAAAARIQNQASWVDQQIRVAMAKGEFDNLPGAGKPIKDLGSAHDPDWWLKKLIEREQVTGVLPPALQLRKDDAELDRRLDELSAESEVRREVEHFNARVLKARYTPVDGPPLVTQPRDLEETVAAWQERRAARRADRLAQTRRAPEPEKPAKSRRRWWQRREIRHTDQ